MANIFPENVYGAASAPLPGDRYYTFFCSPAASCFPKPYGQCRQPFWQQ